ncbi:hypothetical protein EFL76_00085 [Weissella confusa]|nr:transposase [Weissella confusa]MCT0024089.1 hypothetical protein [Weissella confusa]
MTHVLIKTGLRMRFSNGPIEGSNNKIKAIQRTA